MMYKQLILAFGHICAVCSLGVDIFSILASIRHGILDSLEFRDWCKYKCLNIMQKRVKIKSGSWQTTQR